MKLTWNAQLSDIHKHFLKVTEEQLNQAEMEAQQEVQQRVRQLADFEQLDLAQLESDERIQAELANSEQNLTLSYLQYQQDRERYSPHYKDIFDFVQGEGLDDTFFEQSVTEGHPFHPMTKTKLGFNSEQVVTFSPEFRQQAQIIPVLCASELVTQIHPTHSTISPEYMEWLDQLQNELSMQNIDISRYEMLFLHEWQLEHFVKQQYPELLQQEQLIPLYQYAISARPLLSFRTLDVPQFNAIVKTAVNVQATSAVRNVSPASIRNGIALSEVVAQIYAKGDYHRSAIQRDLAGAFLNINAEHANKVSYLLRERLPETTQAPQTHHLVCASLITKSFITDQHILIECIERLMERQDLSFETATTQFLEQYTAVILEATYRLLLEEEISLEAHMQNSTIEIQDCLPTKIYVRDFGGVRLFDREVDIDGSTGLIADDFDELLAVFSHSVLYNHLFQLIRVLEQYGYEPSIGYYIIREQLRKYNDRYQPQIDLLQQPTFRIKSLLKMRIYEDGYDYQHTYVNNPLYEKGATTTCNG
ncbi:IucA/IucC family protein [Staphylococcus pettenkoferi]|uniref:IucA/IucC family protein n=1 Tax=Staphylococcus pettenkoferi TaxID=170573 RepID=UPI0020C11E8F|nr:IucA/IucC family protein [Staphylococcus pettenkoferi]